MTWTATIPLGLICETQAEFSLWPTLPVEYVIPHHKLVRKNLIDEIKDAGKKILVWTVNATVGHEAFFEMGSGRYYFRSPQAAGARSGSARKILVWIPRISRYFVLILKLRSGFIGLSAEIGQICS